MYLLLIVLSISSVVFSQTDSTKKLNEYVGTYQFPDSSIVPTVTVSIENGGLIISSVQGSSTLEKQEEDLYLITAFNGTCLFKRNESKVIIGVHIEAGGYILDGDKLPEEKKLKNIFQEKELFKSLR